MSIKKRNGYWDKDKCQREALKYKTKKEFRDSKGGAYQFSKRKGWVNEICGHMVDPRMIWDKDKCQREALKYNTKKEFKIKNSGAYNAVYRNGWVDEICAHMKSGSLNWTLEKCKEESLKYKSRTEFQIESKGAYLSTCRNNWLDDVCGHMIEKKKPNGYWSKTNCKKEALKYNSKTEFIKNASGAYDKAIEFGWLDEVCMHMIPQASLKDRYVYSFEFPLYNSVYIGLTWNMFSREIEHLYNDKSQVYKFIKENNNPSYIYKNLGLYDMKIAGSKEGEWLQKYKNNSWIILNKAKTGGLGGNRLYWTKIRCQEEALKYNKKTDFINNSKSAYGSSRRNGWLDEVCEHMVIIKKSNSYWTKIRCQEEALKYKSKTFFKNNSSSAYSKAYKNGWLDEICLHMKKVYRIYTYESCEIEANKYNNRSELHNNNSTAYYYALKNNLLNIFYPKN